MPKVQLRDLTINYEERGEGKPEVILLTGLGGTMQNWVDNPGIYDICAENHRTVIMDNRGAGETSDGELDYVTNHDMAEDVLEAIADTFFSVRTTDLVGFQHQQVALRDFDVADRLGTISCPVLVAHGLYDCLIPCENGITIAKSIPDARFLLMPNSSHAGLEDTELFNGAVREFIAE